MGQISLAEKLIKEAIEKKSTFLDLGNCGLTDDSPELKLLEQCDFLEELNFGKLYRTDALYYSQVTFNNEIPNEFQSIPKIPLSNLRKISLANCGIKIIENLNHLVNLKELNLANNQIIKINNLQNLLDLHTLVLERNNIELIENIEHLVNLHKLYLYDNKISKIENIENLANLQILSLLNNQITSIENLNKLTNLQELDLRSNQITYLPYLQYFKKLHVLRIRFNPLKNFPVELHCDDTNKYDDFNCFPHYKAWFEDLEKGKENNKQIKVFFTGNGNVGKSSVIEALKNGKCTENKHSTHGIIIENITSKNKEVDFNIWDFGGQEIYYGTHQLFTKGDAINCIVFDTETENKTECIDRITKEKTKNFCLQFWQDIAWQNNKINPTIIIQNKVDRDEDNNTITISGPENQHLLFIGLSATTGDKINELEEELIIAAKTLAYYDMEIPKSWIAVRGHILQLQNPKSDKYTKIIELETFNTLCAEHQVVPNSNQSLLYFLHQSGTLFYDEKFLDNKIIIDQQWAIDAIYKALERGSDFYNLLREFNRGYCTLSRLYTAWNNEYTEKEQQLFVSFMSSCGLCFPVRNEMYAKDAYDKNCMYVFPEFLSNEEPQNVTFVKSIISSSDSIKLKQEFTYLSSNIIQSTISKLSEYANLEHIWRNGIMITYNNQYILVEADYTNKQILFYFSTSLKSTKLLELIISKLDVRNNLKEWQIKYSKDDNFSIITDTILNDLIIVYNKKNPINLINETNDKTVNIENINTDFDFNNKFETKEEKSDFIPRFEKIGNSKSNHENTNDYKYPTNNNNSGITHFNNEPKKTANENRERAINNYNYIVHHTTPLRAFISYSKNDGEESKDGTDYLKEFKITLAPLINQEDQLLIWDDTKLYAGEDWDDRIKDELIKSEVIFFLVSRNLLATNYVKEVEMKIAIDKLEKNECIIIPIHIKTCSFEDITIFKKRNVIPRKGISIASYKNDPKFQHIDDAWKAVYNEIKNAINEFKKNKSAI